MARRRAHTKSRGGCRQCKTRRIKCDEVRPVCKTCQRHDDYCDFTALRHLRSEQESSASRRGSSGIPNWARSRGSSMGAHRESSVHRAIEPLPTLRPAGDGTPSDRLLELRLMHGYMSVAASIRQNFPLEHESAMTSYVLPRLALESYFLMDALLSVAALYLRALNPADQTIVQASHKYAVRAIRECSRQIQVGVRETNAEPLFVTTTLIAYHGFGSRQYIGMSHSGSSSSTDMRSLQWFKLFQGVRAIREAGWSWLQNSTQLLPLMHYLPAKIQARLAEGRLFFEYLLEGLEHEKVGAETRSSYERAVGYLSFVYYEPRLRGILGFPLVVSKRFVDLMEARDPRTLTIVGSYLALMRMSDMSRFLMGAAEREFCLIMGELPHAWRPRMAWAMSIPPAKGPNDIASNTAK